MNIKRIIPVASAILISLATSAGTIDAEPGNPWKTNDFVKTLERATAGDPDAQRQVGNSYRYGIDVKQNINEAWKWYSQSAGNGDSESQYILGTFYRDGVGVKKNMQEAAYWFRRAGRNGHAAAQVEIARQFAEGEGVLQDYRVAAENYWRAAEQGNAEGAYYYAILLRDGRGVNQDLPRALKYFKQAAASGYKDANVLADMLEEQGIKVPTTREVRQAAAERVGSKPKATAKVTASKDKPAKSKSTKPIKSKRKKRR